MAKERESIDFNEWTIKMSKCDGLKLPNRECSYIIYKCDREFVKYHRNGLRLVNPFERLSELIISKHPTFPRKLVELFVRVRTFSRRVLSKYLYSHFYGIPYIQTKHFYGLPFIQIFFVKAF